MIERLRGALAHVRERTSLVPRVALVLGQGTSLDGDVLTRAESLELPELGEGAAVTLGWIGGVPVAVQSGSSADGIASVHESGVRVRLLRLLGAEALLVAGVCYALDPSLAAGDLVLVEDHLNLLGENPLVGPNIDEMGPRFPDLTEAYDPALRSLAREVAAALGARLGGGVFAAIRGPSLRAMEEFLKLRTLGADLVGAGVVPEVIVARHMGMRALALLAVAGDLASPPGPAVGRVLGGMVARMGSVTDRGAGPGERIG